MLKKGGFAGLLMIGFTALIFTSCVSHDSIVNFNSGEIDMLSGQSIENVRPIRIATDDVLLISVYSYEPDVAAPFNVGISGQRMAAEPAEYRVDSRGMIAMPGLGPVEVVGLSTAEAARKIEEELTHYIHNPIVNLRHKGFSITILGEVSSPSTYLIDAERVTILQALGLAGDLTDYANRENILIIRETDGIREIGRLDMHSPDILNSPYFFLKQNDVIYIEPTKSRVATVADPVTRVLPYIGLGLTVLNIFITVSRL